MEEKNLFLTEVLESNDPRTESKQATDAERKELEGLYSQGVFEEVSRLEILHNAVILPSKFVYAIKNVSTDEEEYKARYAGRWIS